MGALPGELALTCLRPAAPALFTLKEKRSEFIAALVPASTPEEARAALDAVRQKHKQATHNCPAWRIGFPTVEEFSSDDGEPSGTAGRPILGCLQKAGLCNAVIVVTRYFGGVKLGVRGLIDAYSAAADGVIAQTATETVRPFRQLLLRSSYDRISSLSHALRSAGVSDERVKTSYAEDVAVQALVELSLEPRLRELLDSYEAQTLLLAPPEWSEQTVLA